MPGKLNLYNLGDLGVDLVSSLLHAATGSWRKLQNAEFSNVEGQGGVKKRGSLRRLNADALNGGANILVLANMPLATDALVAPTEGPLFVALSGGGALVSSDLGASFSTPAGLTSVVSKLVVIGGFGYGISGAPEIVKWSSTTESTEVNTITDFPGMTTGSLVDLVTDGTELWALVHDTTDDVARVFHWAPGDSPVQYGSDMPIPLVGGDGDLNAVTGLTVLAGVAYVQGDFTFDSGASVLHSAYMQGPTFPIEDPWTGSGGAEYAQSSPGMCTVAGKAVGLGFHGATPFVAVDSAFTTADGVSANTIAGTVAPDNIAANVAGDMAILIVAATGFTPMRAYLSTDGTSWSLDEDLTATLGVTGTPQTIGIIAVGVTYTFAVVFDGANWQLARRLNSTGDWDLAPGIPGGASLSVVAI